MPTEDFNLLMFLAQYPCSRDELHTFLFSYTRASGYSTPPFYIYQAALDRLTKFGFLEQDPDKRYHARMTQPGGLKHITETYASNNSDTPN